MKAVSSMTLIYKSKIFLRFRKVHIKGRGGFRKNYIHFQKRTLLSMAEGASLPLSPISELMQRYQGSNLEPEYTVHKVDGSDHCPVFEARVEVLALDPPIVSNVSHIR